MQALQRCTWHKVAMGQQAQDRVPGRRFPGMSYRRGSMGSGGQTQEGAELSQTAYHSREQPQWGECRGSACLALKYLLLTLVGFPTPHLPNNKLCQRKGSGGQDQDIPRAYGHCWQASQGHRSEPLLV